MRIAQLIPEFPGQTHIFFWREINALREMGIDCSLVSTSRPAASIVCHEWSHEAMNATRYLYPPSAGDLIASLIEFLRAGPLGWWGCASVIFGPGVGGIKQRLKLVGLLVMGARLAALGREEGWTHVHAQSCGDCAYIAVFASALGRITYSMNLHGALEYYGLGQGIKWGRMKFGATVTETLKQDVLGRVSKAASEKIDIAPMGVDLDVFTRSAEYRARREGDPMRLVTCARLHQGKGHQDVLAAIAILKARGLVVRFTLLGEGPARQGLQALVQELGLSEDVVLEGAKPEGAVRSALESSHVFCLASHEEALGVATMEAMAMGLPVVVTRVGGVHELVRDGVDGVMVPAKNPEAIAAAIERLARDPALATSMGASGMERVRQGFSSRRSAEVIAGRLGVKSVATPAAGTTR